MVAPLPNPLPTPASWGEGIHGLSTSWQCQDARFQCCNSTDFVENVCGFVNETQPELSLVIPCYNEQDNLRALIKAIRAAADPLKLPYEVVVTDDCSKDKSWEILKELAAADPRIRPQRFAFNCGESAALWAGMKASRGPYIITLDADLQNDPTDLPAFLRALEKFDCVCGTRVATRGQGDNCVRIASSRIANWVRNKLSGEQISGRRLHLSRLQARVRRRPEIFQRHAPFLADADQNGRLHRDGDHHLQPSAIRRADPLRCLEPALRLLLRFPGRALDEKAHVPLPNRGKDQP